MSLTNTQVSKIYKTFANGFSANIKLSKTQLHKIGLSGGFLGRILRLLLNAALPLKKNLLKPANVLKQLSFGFEHIPKDWIY